MGDDKRAHEEGSTAARETEEGLNHAGDVIRRSLMETSSKRNNSD